MMEELRKEKQARLDALFGTVPTPNDEDDEDEGAFPVANQEVTPESLAAEMASAAEDAAEDAAESPDEF